MTRKDYVRLAAALAAAHPQHHLHDYDTADAADGAYNAWAEAVNAVAHALAADSPRFDLVRFLEAADARR